MVRAWASGGGEPSGTPPPERSWPAYLLAAAMVVAAHKPVPVPEWLALHLLVLGVATNAVNAREPVRRPCAAAHPGSALVLAHAQVNLLGWLGLAIICTQFMLWPRCCAPG